jgi:hypothetical protein
MLAAVNELLKLGKWVDKPDSRGRTPLMVANRSGRRADRRGLAPRRAPVHVPPSGWQNSAATAKWSRSSSATPAEVGQCPASPGLGWYALAGSVFLAGLVLGGILVWRFVAGFEPAVRFLAPGEVAGLRRRAGDQVIWHEHRTVYQGRGFNVDATMPDGTRYRVQAPDGSAVAVETQSGMSSESSEERSVSVAHFAASSAGVYRISVEGVTDARVMAVGPNRAWPIMKLAGELFPHPGPCVLLRHGDRSLRIPAHHGERQARPHRARTRRARCAGSRGWFTACRRRRC